MGNFIDILLWISTPFIFLSTIRLSLKGIIKLPDHWTINIFLNEMWCVLIVFFMPWYLVAFARGEITPLPWVALIENWAASGVSDAVLAVLIVTIVDIWLLWTPSQLYVSKLLGSERYKARFARIINGLTGLLLITPGHPFYRLCEYF